MKLIVVICLLAVCVSCDELPTPPTVPDQPASNPSTQNAQRKAMGIFPMTVELPAGWDFKTIGSIVFLQGPAVGGEVRIQLNPRPKMTENQIALLVESAQKELKADPVKFRMVDLRTHNGMKVLERQSIGANMPNTDLTGQPLPDTSPTLRWTINVYIPAGKEYQTCELNFVALSSAQYEANQAMLRGIIDSLKPE